MQQKKNMILSRPNKSTIFSNRNLNIMIVNENIEIVKNIKYFGMQLDPYLNFSPCRYYMCKKYVR